ncbi:LVIVD repeat-containing protein [Knoellia sp. LjRoot47]|uniref:LVIVD repeat-containing protein n=1 Tax=Knoellia sp. LjRoot47 TaxID=3342330 RepID=UPI003ECE02D7
MRLSRTVGIAAVAALAASGWGVASASAADVPPEAVGKSGVELAPDQVGRSANVQHLFNTPHVTPVDGTGSDIAFSGNKAFVGNYNGFVIYDVTNAASPEVLARVNCPGSQNDITISGDLLYLSTDSSRSDDSCSSTTSPTTLKQSWEGIKIFDVSNPRVPKYLKSVETACGSHTNTLVPGKKSDYIYVSSYSPRADYPDCQPPHDSISIIEVPKKAPTQAKVVAEPNLFPDGGNPGGVQPSGDSYSATTGCHDITAYPSKNIAAGACMGDGVIMDISNPVAPKVIEKVQDTTNFAFWHSATFNNDGTKVVFTDELGGGGRATCNTTVGPKRGANAIYDLSKSNKLTFKSYYKISRHQNDSENCVAHNGSLIPVKGRDIMVQSWYMGGTSIWDFTDSANPREIGYFERGPNGGVGGGGGGTWSSYYYNGHIFSSDLGKGFDVLKITEPSLQKAAKVKMDELNPQSQPVYKTR